MEETKKLGLFIEAECPHCSKSHILQIFHSENVFQCPFDSSYFGITSELIAASEKIIPKPAQEKLLPVSNTSSPSDPLMKKAITKSFLALSLSERAKTTIKDKPQGKNAPLPPPIKTLQFGRYKSEEMLGCGGFGIVYRGYDSKLERFIAIKRSISPLEENYRIEEFKKEAQTLAQLNHPNIIQVYDFDLNEDQIPYIIMEFVEGQNICDYLKELKQQDQNDFLLTAGKFFSKLAEALAFLHKHDIFHQDLKPANILISKESGSVKLLDFGLAIQGNDELTHFEGTCRYCAPERFERGYKPTIESDIYSFGIVLYKALTGKEAIIGKEVTDYISNIISGKLTLDFAADKIDEALQKICEKCLQLSPKDRYHNASDLQFDLECFVNEFTDTNEEPYLYLLEKDGGRIVFPLTKKKFFIGRSFGNDLILQSNSISRIQAVLFHNEKEASLTNLSKRVPIRVNNNRLPYKKTISLQQMDSIEIVDYLLFYVPPKLALKKNLPEKKAALLSTEQVKLLLFIDDEELAELFKEGTLVKIQKGNEAFVEAESLLNHIEKSSGNKIEIALPSKERTSTPKIKISIFDKDEFVQNYAFGEEESLITIGRGDFCDIYIDGLGISRVHCQIEQKKKGFYTLTDLNSHNGTYIKGQKIHKYNLNLGDIIFIGKNHRILFEEGQASSHYLPQKLENLEFEEVEVEDGDITVGPKQTARLKRKAPIKGNAFLKFIGDSGEKETKNLIATNTFFGADPSCDFVFQGEGIPLRQILITKEEEDFYLINLFSKEGLFLNEKEITHSMIKNGDCIRIGEKEYKFYFVSY